MAYDRGTVVLAPEPYTNEHNARPFLLVSSEDYKPNGYLGLPLTRSNKRHTVELSDYDKEEVYEPFEKDDNYINPCSPCQVNNPHRPLCLVSEDLTDMVAELTARSIGVDT